MNTYTITGEDKNTGTTKVLSVQCTAQRTAEAYAKRQGLLIETISIISPLSRPETPEQTYLRITSFWISFWSRLAVAIICGVIGLGILGLAGETISNWIRR